MMDDVTIDDFMSGAIKVAQPKSGYRAGIDPILLAASIPAKSGQTVLELGCGVGTASLALSHRVTDLKITGVEVQERYAELARHNADLNNLPLSVVRADLAALPSEIRDQQFDHVFANPPYFDRGSSTRSDDGGRDRAMGESDELEIIPGAKEAIADLRKLGYRIAITTNQSAIMRGHWGEETL